MATDTQVSKMKGRQVGLRTVPTAEVMELAGYSENDEGTGSVSFSIAAVSSSAYAAGMFWVADYIRFGGGTWAGSGANEANYAGAMPVTFTATGSGARLFYVLYDTEATMQRALRVDLAFVLHTGMQLPGWASSECFLINCAQFGSEYLNDALASIGCTPTFTTDPGDGSEVLPSFSPPGPGMVDALASEYLGSHPWYHTE